MNKFAKCLLVLWTALSATVAGAETYQVSTAAEFTAALTKANGATGDVIEITSDFELTGSFQVKKYACTIRSGAGGPYTITTGSSVITLGKDNNNVATIVLEDVVFSGGTASTFSLTTGGSLTLGDGAVLRDYALNAEKAGPVYVSGGSFTMLSGSQIANIANTSTKSLSSAIYGDKGAVNLLGGTISGCSSVKSGGAAAYLTSNISTFTIGGDFTAINNTADGRSANVSVASATQMKLVAQMTGLVGIAYPATPAEGSAFGIIGENYTATSADAACFRCDTTDLSYVGNTSEGKLVWREKLVGYDGESLKATLMAEAVEQGKPIDAVTITTTDPKDFAHAWFAETNDVLGAVVYSSTTLTEPSEQVRLEIGISAPGRLSFSGAVIADETSDCRLDLYFVKDGVTNHVDQLVGNHPTWERADTVVSGAGTLLVVFTGDSELKSAKAYLRNLLFTPSDGSAENPYPVTSAADAVAYCAGASGDTVHLTLEADVTGDIAVPAGVNVVIDLNGHTLTGGISGGGDITVDDSSDAGRGSVTGTVVATGALTINAGVYSFDPTAVLGAGCLVEAEAGGWLVSAPISVDSRDHTLDTRPGVRVVSTQSDVLPITYSGTEWIDLTTTKGTAYVSQTPSFEREGPDYRTYENNLTDNGADAYLYSVPKSDVHNQADIYTVSEYRPMGDGTLEQDLYWDTAGKCGLWRLKHVVNGQVLMADFLFPSRTVDVVVTWVNGRAYDEAQVTLQANGAAIGLEEPNPAVLGETADWKHTFERVPVKDADGDEIAYTVAEAPLAGYTTTYSEREDGTLVVINTRLPIAPPLNDAHDNEPPTIGANGWTVVDDPEAPWLTVPDPLGGDGANQVVTPSIYSEPLAFTVKGDGEFCWSQLFRDLPADQISSTVTVTVDGQVVYVFTPGDADDDAWKDYVVHVRDTAGNDQAEHTITIDFDRTDATDYYIDNVNWRPAASQVQMKDLVSVPQNAVTDLLPSVKSTTSVTNELNSGWMPIASPDDPAHITGVRTADGPIPVDGNGDYVNGPYVSTFALKVEGPGTLDVGSLGLDGTDLDGGVLTVLVDGKPVAVFDADRDPSAWSTTVGGPDGEVHVVEFRYEREARDPSKNSAAVIENISWTPATMPPAEEGGVTWLVDEGKALMIVDHEDPGQGFCYLAFNPQLKYPELLQEWVTRTACPGKIKAKVGLTRAEMEASEPIDCTLREWDPVDTANQQVWVKVQLPAAVQSSVGYWRIWVEGSVIPFDTLSGYHLTYASDGVALRGANSVNIFGIIKVESATTNTIVAIPWTWYSAREQESTRVPACKLVKTTNLTPGDLLYALTEDGAYSAWTVVRNKTTGILEWEAIKVVYQDENASEDGFHYTASGSHPDLRMARGSGMWLTRQRPLDDAGNVLPFWLYGQSIVADVQNTVRGGTAASPAYTILANPFCEQIALNDLVFAGTIGSGDRLILPNGGDGSRYVQWDAAQNKWCWVETVLVGRRMKNVYHYDMTVPAGTGFWYVRRTAGEVTVTWPSTR